MKRAFVVSMDKLCKNKAVNRRFLAYLRCYGGYENINTPSYRFRQKHRFEPLLGIFRLSQAVRQENETLAGLPFQGRGYRFKVQATVSECKSYRFRVVDSHRRFLLS